MDLEKNNLKTQIELLTLINSEHDKIQYSLRAAAREVSSNLIDSKLPDGGFKITEEKIMTLRDFLSKLSSGSFGVTNYSKDSMQEIDKCRKLLNILKT